MDGELLNENNRDRILSELKSIIKQVYHEAVNHELRQENVNYITQNLLKWLDESLLYGVKNPQHGYWKIVQKILHPDSLSQLSLLPQLGTSGRCKGRAWIAISLLDDAFVSYMNCFVKESLVAKNYQEWSIVRNSDSCNAFLSLLTGLQNISFRFQLADNSKTIQNAELSLRLIAPTPSWSPAPSLSDSGVQLDRSEDYLNGNLTAPVVLRRRVKDTQRHVSFHEDSYSKSPSQRRLKWDVENSRYSWAGEELDGFKLPDLRGVRNAQNIAERGVPEGEETPRSRKGPEVKSLHCSRIGQGKLRLNRSKSRIDWDQVARINRELEIEICNFRRPRLEYQVHLPSKLIDMLKLNRSARSWSYKLMGKMLIITGDKLIILHRDLHTTILSLAQLEQVVVQPHMHSFHLLTKKKNYVLTSGEEALSREILTRLAFNMHRAALPLIDFRILHPEEIHDVQQELITRKVLTDMSSIFYLGVVRQQPGDTPPPVTETVDKRGPIMYQLDQNQQWLPGNLILRGGVLYLHGEKQSPVAAVNLSTSCSSCERTQIRERPHTFRISLKHPFAFANANNCFYEDVALKSELASQRSTFERWANGMLPTDTISQWATRFGSFLRSDSANDAPSTISFAAADEYEISDWLQAILLGFCPTGESWETEASECSLLITEDSVALFVQPDPPQRGFRVLASALINEISALYIGCHPQDSYTIIELSCMEAGMNTSDWIVHFGSRAELNKVLAILESQWRRPESFPISVISDLRCERTQACLTKEWFS